MGVGHSAGVRVCAADGVAGGRAVKGLWIVMDERAKIDVDEAAILQAQEGRRDKKPKGLSQMWSGQCLCWAPEHDDGKSCGPAEYVEDIL